MIMESSQEHFPKTAHTEILYALGAAGSMKIPDFEGIEPVQIVNHIANFRNYGKDTVVQ
jgi:hypothetical protein